MRFPTLNFREKGLQGGVMAGDGCRFDGPTGGGLGRLKNRKFRSRTMERSADGWLDRPVNGNSGIRTKDGS